jgi:hypothetical protein
MSAPPKLCGFDLLPLRDFHLMVSWVPPGITSRNHGVFSVREPGPDRSECPSGATSARLRVAGVLVWLSDWGAGKPVSTTGHSLPHRVTASVALIS